MHRRAVFILTLIIVAGLGTLLRVSASGHSITSLNPSSTAAGSESFLLIISGSGFEDGMVVQWNRDGSWSNKTTIFETSTKIDGAILAADVDCPGSAQVRVFNPVDSSVSNELTFQILNNAPDAVDDTATIPEDNGPTPIAVLDNDTHSETSDSCDALTIVSAGPASNGTVSFSATSLTYEPNLDFVGTDTFTYTVQDEFAGLDTATVNVTVSAVNDAPVGVDDFYNTNENTTLTVPAPGVLANDSDVEGDPLNAVLDSGPSNGTLTLNADGSFTYTPDTNFDGTDIFTYFANDGLLLSDIVTVTIAITPVDNTPVANDQLVTTDEDTPVSFTLDASDPDSGDTLSYTVTSGPSNGTLSGTAPNLTYTPDPDYFGADSFSYVVTDTSGLTDTATVDITVNAVNDAPVGADDSYTTSEDTPLTVAAPGVLSNDSDVEGDTLSAVLDAGPSNGTLMLNADGSFTYTPDANFAGTDSFTYRADDGQASNNLSDPITVVITITAVNDAPVANDQNLSTNEDTALSITLTASDPDSGDTLSYTVTGGPSNGTLSGTAPNLTYTPDPDYFGADSFSYEVTDTSGLTDTATVDITVNAVNDAPVGADDSYTTSEDTPLTVAAPGVLSNDSDVEGDTLSAVLDAGPSNGTLMLNADGSFTYTPDANFAGTDSFTYRADDGQASNNLSDPITVVITITAVNDAPVANDQNLSTNEDTALSITLTASDPDSGDTLSYTVTSGPSNGTLSGTAPNLTYTPDPDYFGADSFSYEVTDTSGLTDTATVDITVNAVNDAPVGADDSYTTSEDTPLTVAAPGVLSNDSDVEGDTLSAVLDAGPSNGTLMLNADGSFTYTPDANFAGTDSFTYRADDGQASNNLSDPITVVITITAVNDAPVANDQNLSTNEDTALSITLTASDPDSGDTLSYTVTSGPSNGTLSGTAPNLTYTPDPDYFGADSFSYEVTDTSGLTDTATVDITVNAVNDAPSFTIESASVTVPEDAGPQSITSWATSISPGASNESDQTLTFLVSNDNNALFSTQPAIDSAGTLTFTPAANAYGSATVTVQLQDDGGTLNSGKDTSGQQTFTITVDEVNDPPTVVDNSFTVRKNSSGNVFDVLINDSIAPDTGETLSIVLVTIDASTTGDISIINDGTALSYTPMTDFIGTDVFSYTVSDDRGALATAMVTVTVIEQEKIYLPMVMNGPKPDLVGSFSLAPNKLNFTTDEQVLITAVITNQGTQTSGPFWVDFYINPSPIPTGPNVLWNTTCTLSPCYGIAWYVDVNLAPGESITLTSTADSYATEQTRWIGLFAAGTTDLYMYIDSYNPGVSTAAVVESDETNNRAELHSLTVTGAMNDEIHHGEPKVIPKRPLHPNR
ncbi:MAG: hypothetical protein KatS3mg057_1279 [Herpetosiphonaceae bacterium]|nr:MAG: hypothetical protein KatS3mg057_1279 [Herpetosiphonaceae bacterium]